jgi:hypothetical protein
MPDHKRARSPSPHSPSTPEPRKMARLLRTWFAPLVLLLALFARLGGAWTPGRAAPDVFITRATANVTLPDLYEASIVELQAGMHAGHFSAADLVRAYTARIAEVNTERAVLRAVIETNPSALFEAQVLDEERAVFGARGPLHGIPVRVFFVLRSKQDVRSDLDAPQILLKDNIATLFAEGEGAHPPAYIQSR